MTERKRRLYRAVITAGFGERLLEVSGPDSEVWSYFGPGTSRCYQSKRAADHRAELWRAHGCTVRIDVSEPIVWPELCEFCLEPVAGHTEAEAASCQIDLRSAT